MEEAEVEEADVAEVEMAEVEEAEEQLVEQMAEEEVEQEVEVPEEQLVEVPEEQLLEVVEAMPVPQMRNRSSTMVLCPSTRQMTKVIVIQQFIFPRSRTCNSYSNVSIQIF